ncbi:unnamed protein product [Orchesella dallaii]|uniref:Gustatory receptor n=1 Tax=Orchesella dallaii TaxID=48710 RepID=A0ABP1QWE6_9HEXA
MLHKLAKTTFDFLFTGSRLFDTHPIRWNEDKTRLVVSECKFTLFRWKFQLSLIFLYAFFIYYRLYDSLVNMKIPAEQCVIQLFYAISFFYYCSNNFNYYVRRKEIAEFVTIFFKFDELFQAKPHQIQRTKKFAESLLAFLAAGLGNGLFQGPCFLYFSKNRNFLFSIVEPYLDTDSIYWARFPFALIEIWISTLSWMGSLFHTFIWFAMANCMPLWTTYMIYNDKAKKKRPLTRTIYYRSLQCLMIQFNDCYAWFSFMGVKLSAFFGLICVLYGSLRFYGKIPIVGYAVLPLSVFMGFLYAFLMFPAAGKASDALMDMLNGWGKIGLHFIDKQPHIGLRKLTEENQKLQPQNQDPTDAMTVTTPHQFVDDPHKRMVQQRQTRVNRFKLNLSLIRSCPVVGFRVGSFYCVTTATTFTFCDMVINQTINCLLSF